MAISAPPRPELAGGDGGDRNDWTLWGGELAAERAAEGMFSMRDVGRESMLRRGRLAVAGGLDPSFHTDRVVPQALRNGGDLLRLFRNEVAPPEDYTRRIS